MRLARVLRKQQKLGEAIAVYGELATLGETPVGGAVAELIARRERIVLLNALGGDGASEEAQLLASRSSTDVSKSIAPHTTSLRWQIPSSMREDLPPCG
jgi:hypothetical protein